MQDNTPKHAENQPVARAFGICLGASTVSAVEIQVNGSEPGPKVSRVIREPHEGNPKDTFAKVIEDLNIDGAPVLITGRKFRSFVNLPSITEPEAVEQALEYISNGSKGEWDALISAGGETFMVYSLNGTGRIQNISTGNKCASGTGEFFLQQIRRMDLGLEEAVDLATGGSPYPVSGRCSVFCKSDCTHALNKGEPITDVTAGLCRMIAQKILEILERLPRKGRVMLVGGTAQNRAVTDYLKKELVEIDIPEEAPYFEALGAAITAFEKGDTIPVDLFRPETTNFTFLSPLKDYEDLVTFNTIEYGSAQPGDKCIIGLDVGSTTTKAVLLRLADHSFLGSVYLRTNGNPVEASRACYGGLLERLGGTKVEIAGIGVTGSGRQIAGLYTMTGGIINEIIAHAAAAVYFDDEVDTIFEIGGQDAKYTYITNSVASDYAMNQACSAGTGSFLEEAAFESLGIKMEDIADLALQGRRPPNFNDQCAAFISSDIKNAVHEGITQNDILAGLVYSICVNYINRVKGARTVGKKVFLQGGVCYNRAVPLAMAGILQKPIVVPPEPGLMGAFGVALELEKRLGLGLIEEETFDLEEIARRQVVYKEPFVCPGGKEKCDRKCSILRIEIEGKIHPFGGACNRYYNLRFNKSQNGGDLDLVQYRNEEMFRSAAGDIDSAGMPVSESRDREGSHAAPPEAIKHAPVVGLNRSFLSLSLFPLYYTFLKQLGCRVVMPDEMSQKALNRLVTSLCFPAEISISFFENLLTKEPDFIFMPLAKELHVPGGIERLDFCSTCGFSRGEAFVLGQAYRQEKVAERILAPTVIFNGGWEKGESAFLESAAKMGFRRDRARAAFRAGVRAQYDFEDRIAEKGKEILEEIHSDPGNIGIVIFGRPYNAYVPEANKGIPIKLTSRGYRAIPYDMLPFQDEPLRPEYADYMHWETGQKVLRAAQIVERDPQLYGLYVTNFLCAPDSFIVSYFRKVMGKKPSLTLELDAHAADAGINTRIEAFLDIIQNYRKLHAGIPRYESGGGDSLQGNGTNGYRQAVMSYEHNGTFYIDSRGQKFSLKDDRVKLLIPPMGVVASKTLAAICRKIGIRTEAMPPSDAELFRLGRNVTTGKECLPMIICIGALVRYLENRTAEQKKEKTVMLLPKASGHCRFGQYHVYTSQFIRENKIEDVALLDLGMEDRWAGLGPAFSLNAWKAVVISDLLEDIDLAIHALARDREKGRKIYEEESKKILAALEDPSSKVFYRQLKESARRFRSIPLKAAYHDSAKVCLTGEFFVRRDPFSNLDVGRRLAEKGFIVITDPIAAVMYYSTFMIKEKIVEPRYTLAGWIEFFVSDKTQHFVERKIKRIMRASGLCDPELVDLEDLIKHSEILLPRACDGEMGVIAGTTLRDGLTHYSGIVNVGPFGCMQTRFADAVTIPAANMAGKLESQDFTGKVQNVEKFAKDEQIPFLSIESDGNPFPQLLQARFESFCLQAGRIAEKQGKNVIS